MTTSLPQLKAEFFKTLGHPLRVRILELLTEKEHSVGEMLLMMDVEPSNLSQQLAILRRSGLVSTRREGSTARYALARPEVVSLLEVARHIIATLLVDQVELLGEVSAASAAPRITTRSGSGAGGRPRRAQPDAPAPRKSTRS